MATTVADVNATDGPQLAQPEHEMSYLCWCGPVLVHRDYHSGNDVWLHRSAEEAH